MNTRAQKLPENHLFMFIEEGEAGQVYLLNVDSFPQEELYRNIDNIVVSDNHVPEFNKAYCCVVETSSRSSN